MPSSPRSKSSADAAMADDTAGERDTAALERRLGHSFRDPRLLRRALTHRSASADNYERLEYLGDAALGFFVGLLLCEHAPNASEQRLTLMRAHLVNTAALADLGRELRLGRYLALGSAERRNGVGDQASILADTVEALIGAIVQDGGQDAALAVVGRLFESRIAAARAPQLKDPKTRLQEHLQQRGLPVPRYRIVATQGPAHAPVYTIECVVEGDLRFRGVGGNRREAEKAAADMARQALEVSEREPPTARVDRQTDTADTER